MGPRVISAPENVGGVNIVAVEIRVEPWEFWYLGRVLQIFVFSERYDKEYETYDVTTIVGLKKGENLNPPQKSESAIIFLEIGGLVKYYNALEWCFLDFSHRFLLFMFCQCLK